MSNEDIILTEQCGSLGNPVQYLKQGQQKEIKRRQICDSSVTTSFFQAIFGFVRDVLLPYGYPDSVSEDYLEYQLWDTVQAFCSTITSIFTTQAILKGVGVGNAEASALSATITWILKDGTGMIGRIVFAWWKGNELDCYCKKWRLLADFLNDSAMVLELCIPYFSHWSMEVLCISTAMKSVVGVAGGATRASITSHQAVKGNTAEISAKDGSQETLVNLVASLVGLLLLNYFNDPVSQWAFTVFLIILHLYANYRAVTSLIFKHLNDLRMALVLKSYLILNAVSNPEKINKMESVMLGFGLKVQDFCGFKIRVGNSLKKALVGSQSYSSEELESLTHVYRDKRYLLIVDIERKIVNVALEKDETAAEVIAAYHHGILLALATCIYNNVQLDIYSKRQLHHTTPITRLSTFMKTFHHSPAEIQKNLPIEILRAFNEFVDQEIKMFFVALSVADWKTDTHSLDINEWRVEWKGAYKKYD